MGRFNFCLKLDTGELLSSRFSKSNTPVKTSRQISSRVFVSTNHLRKFSSEQVRLIIAPQLPVLSDSTITIITLSYLLQQAE
jgi:hypothetical protein